MAARRGSGLIGRPVTTTTRTSSSPSAHSARRRDRVRCGPSNTSTTGCAARRVNGLLPGRIYTFVVQGCTSTLLGLGADNCRESSKSPGYDAKTSLMAPALRAGYLRSAVRLAGGVPGRPYLRGGRLAHPGRQGQRCGQGLRAYTCIPPATFTAPDTCKVPYVWREARPSDHVCVAVKERSQVAAENSLANQRRAVPS